MTPEVPCIPPPSSAEAILYQYGALGLAVLVFALVIRYLYKENKEERKGMEVERTAAKAREVTLLGEIETEKETCRVEKENMRFEYEKKHREMLEHYSNALTNLNANGQKREDEIRRDTISLVDRLTASREKTDVMVTGALEKLRDRIRDISQED